MPVRLTPIGRLGGRRPLQTKQRGFALLITITLLAFLVLLLVSLASLTRVETQVASNSQQIAQARQNALMALNIAIGQLQKYAGPDQRVTATADLAGDAGGVRLANGASPANTKSMGKINGLGAVQAGTRYWTGVWGNSDLSTDIYTRTPSPVLLNWLVSGNESATFNDTSGQITASNGEPGTEAPSYNPGYEVKNLPTGATPSIAELTENPKINDQPAVVLVGPGSAGEAKAASDQDNYIVVPLVKIEAPAGTVPGLDSAATVGRYAYWVGDEGVKARLNLVDAYATKTDPTKDAEARYRLLTPQRTGAELATGLSTFPVNTAAVGRVLDTQQVRLAANITTDEAQRLIKQRFHDLTGHSESVISNSLSGGLRKDLTAYLEGQTGASSSYTGANIIPTVVKADYSPKYGPQWDLIKSFYDLRTDAAKGTVNVRSATATQMGLSPIISSVRLLVGVEPVENPKTKKVDGGNLLASVAVVLANPYSVALNAPDGYLFKLYFDEDAPQNGNCALSVRYSNTVSKTTAAYSDATLGTPFGQYYTDPAQGISMKSGNAAPNSMINISRAFKIAGPVSIPAGESRVFTIQSDQTLTNYNASGSQIFDLQPGTPAWNASTLYPFIITKITDSAFSKVKAGGAFFFGESSHRSSLAIELWDSSNAPAINPGGTGTYKLLQRASGINVNRWSDSYAVSPVENATGRNAAGLLYIDMAYPGFPNKTISDGRLNSRLRPFIDFNPRAQIFTGVAGSFEAPPYHADFGSAAEFSGGQGFLKGIGVGEKDSVSWGRAARGAQASVIKSCLFDLPQATQPWEVPLFSLAQLQHANLTSDDPKINESRSYWDGNIAKQFLSNSHPNVGWQPGYAIGNSYLPIFVRREATNTPLTHIIKRDGGTHDVSLSHTHYDLSYLLNNALWDDYFLSTLPKTKKPTDALAMPANQRLRVTIDATARQALTSDPLTDTTTAAANLVVEGGFNVNSTSVEAWTSLLGGMKSLAYGAHAASANAVFARSIRQPGADRTDKDDITADPAYSGYRTLTDAQVSSLAGAIVNQVRLRGPFVSLAQFVNRTLSPSLTYKEDAQKLATRGALQSAIDATTINAPLVSDAQGKSTVYSDDIVEAKYQRVDIDHVSLININKPDLNESGEFSNVGTNYIYAESDFLSSDPKKFEETLGYASAGIPGWLTQADVLQAVGPLLTARSDTFRVRTYGDVKNPVTGEVQGRAWCEAIVQRLPDYVDAKERGVTGGTGNLPEDTRSTPLTGTNVSFGRKFKVISFRWLNANDL